VPDSSQTTCWTVVRGAAAGNANDREQFARRYLPAVRSYLAARWRRGPLANDIDDATQEVFYECFRGALARADESRGFRALLYGIARNVARRHEERRRKKREFQAAEWSAVPADEESLSDAFDREWAQSILDLARDRQVEAARDRGVDAQRRVRLLELRFEEGMPIRDIARLWEASPEHLHREYAKARREFKRALMEVVFEHQPGDSEAIERECAHLLGFFS